MLHNQLRKAAELAFAGHLPDGTARWFSPSTTEEATQHSAPAGVEMTQKGKVSQERVSRGKHYILAANTRVVVSSNGV